MSAFRLKSDNEFITPSSDGEGILVYPYKGDINDFKVFQATHRSNDHWGDGFHISATAKQYKALELFGVTIEGDRLKELAKELHGMETKNMFIYVNRAGLCMITQLKNTSIRTMRINDYFGWSEYGVRVPQSTIVASPWNKLDMSNGATMMDVRGLVRDAEEAEQLRRSLEEKNVELATCKKELEGSRKMESVLSKLVEAKEMEVGMVKNQLLGFQANLESMAGFRLP
ncbi:unnamed protein product [Linum trigynum]|uniref:Uncharacterized protein n=1 Tax=Linum trigynum TaxID=586398 RepID=A0AAV2DUY9_9ROSI